MISAPTFREAAQQYGLRLNGMSDDALAAMNLGIIDFHCRAFGISPHIVKGRALAGFKDIVLRAEKGLVEVSVKVVEGTAHPARFNILCFPGDPAAFAQEAVRYFEDLACDRSVLLDTQRVREFLDGLQCDTVSRMVCGVDLREDMRMSRVKLWFFAVDQPGVPNNPVQRALVTSQVDASAFQQLNVHAPLLLGFDLRFDGTVALKLYPDAWDFELRDKATCQRLAQVLSPRALQAMDEAYWTHLYLTTRERDVVLDLHLSNPDGFVSEWLNHPLAGKIHRVYAQVPLLDVVAAIPQAELDREQVESFTLYYMPAESPQGLA